MHAKNYHRYFNCLIFSERKTSSKLYHNKYDYIEAMRLNNELILHL